MDSTFLEEIEDELWKEHEIERLEQMRRERYTHQ